MTNKNTSYNEDDGVLVDDVDEDALAAYREVTQRESASEEAVAGDGDAQKAAQEQEAPKARDDGRDDKGRFSAKSAKAPKSDDRQSEEASEESAEREGAQELAPPPSWGVRAKAAWAELPTEVRQEISKRESEVANGLKALVDYKDIKPYADLAAQSGTTLRTALDHYHGMDRLLARDLAGGLAVAAEAYGHSKEKLAQTFLTLAQRYGAQVSTPQADGQSNDDDALMQILAPVINPLKAQIEQLTSLQTSRVEADRNAQVQSLAQEINRFAADPKNIYFSNVEADIARLFQGGIVKLTGNPAADLKTAYELAIRMNPDIQEALIEKRLQEKLGTNRQKEQGIAAKAKQASRSLSGSRLPGTLYKEAEEDFGADDLEADVRRAYRAHMSA